MTAAVHSFTKRVMTHSKIRVQKRFACYLDLELMTDSDSEDDETAAVVLDHGSSSVKAGFAGDDHPRCVMKSVVGRAVRSERMEDNSSKQVYIGDEAMSKRDVLDLQYPINHGKVTSWDDLERLWHHTFYKKLKVEIEERRVLLTDHVLSAIKDKEKKTEILFETFLVPALYFENLAVLATYAHGRTCAMALDIGDGVAHCVPIFEGYIIKNAIQQQNLAGEDVTEYLMRMLSERGYSFTTSAERKIVRDIKEKLGYVAMDFESEIQTAGTSDIKKEYELPDGQVITIGSERFRCAEVCYFSEFLNRIGNSESINW